MDVALRLGDAAPRGAVLVSATAGVLLSGSGVGLEPITDVVAGAGQAITALRARVGALSQ